MAFRAADRVDESSSGVRARTRREPPQAGRQTLWLRLLPGEPYDLHSVVAAYNCESDIKVPVGDKLYRYYRYSVDEWVHYVHDGFDRANQCMVDANAEFAAMHPGDVVMD